MSAPVLAASNAANGFRSGWPSATRARASASTAHLDVYRDRLNPNFALPQRSDFVGTNGADEWVVVESKGRSWETSASLLATAKRQTRSLRNINGALPVLRAAIATRFSRVGMVARIWDPDDFAEDAEDLDIEPEALAREYYRPAIEYLDGTATERSTHEHDSTEFMRSRLAGMDGWIGIDDDVWEWYHGKRPWRQLVHRRTAGRLSILREAAVRRSERSTESETLVDTARLIRSRRPSLDGVTVELGDSWRDELMRREPGDRAGQSARRD
jgi:hypothetical protein